jgi:hypothetical protein
MSDGGAFITFLAFWGTFIFLLFAIGIAIYILSAIGLSKLAANEGIENPWLAWIPVANMYILGRLIKSLRISTYDIPSIELVLPIGCLAVMILGQIPVIGWIFNIAYFVLFIFALYKLFNMYRPEHATLWLILSIVLPFMGPIFIFIMRNDRPVIR